jgi:hypothetical protein
MQAMQLAAGRAGGAVPGRRGAAAILAACAAAVLLAGCGVAGPAVSGPTRQQLHQALRKWSGFPVSRRPRPLVLAAPHVNGPPRGFPSGAAKLAFISGAIDPPAAPPASPARAAGYPLISAGEAFRALIPAAAQGPAAGIRLKVSTVRLGRAGFMTDRGMRQLPAWLFGFRGIQGSAAVLAVAPAGIFSPPRPALRSPLVSTARLGSNRRTLTAEFAGAAAGTGPCTADYRLELAESRTAVVVGILEHDHAGSMSCAAVGYPRRATAVLLVPLGARVVVDAVSGTAIAVTEVPPRG